MKVAVFTTSYPTGPDDFAGRFVAGLVERVRERGVEVEVVKPGDYRTYGLSSDGGGQLDGMAPGVDGQYLLRQMNVEFFLKYRGLSIQNENHLKSVNDRLTGLTTRLRGAYAQAGYLPHHAWNAFPDNVEFAYRYAAVDGRVGAPSDLRQEHTVAMNLFAEGHAAKFTVEFGRLSLARAGMNDLHENRFRMQWDVHF